MRVRDRNRDLENFPNDANGDVLRRMQADGDDLTVARDFDFSVIFPSEEAAIGFALHLLRNGQKVSLAPYPEQEELPWEVTVHPRFVPTHANITNYERLLASDASTFGGRNDGWGCMQVGNVPSHGDA